MDLHKQEKEVHETGVDKEVKHAKNSPTPAASKQATTNNEAKLAEAEQNKALPPLSTKTWKIDSTPTSAFQRKG